MTQTQCLVTHPWFYLRRKIRKILDSLEQSSAEADQGETALSTLRSHPAGYNFALIDLNTPGINGLRLLEIIKEDACLNHLKVIIVAEDLSIAVIDDLIARGADGYLHQDFTRAELEEVLLKATRAK